MGRALLVVVLVAIVGGVLLWTSGIGSAPTPRTSQAAEPVIFETPIETVAVSVPPLIGLVEPLLAPGIEVVSAVAPGASPHGAEITPSRAASVRSADFGIAASESDAIAINRWIGDRHVFVLTSGDGSALCCSETGTDLDVHPWLSPSHVVEMIEALTPALREAGVPMASNEAIEAHLIQIKAMDQAWRETLSAHAEAMVVTQHDAWGHALMSYGLARPLALAGVQAEAPRPSAVAEAMGSTTIAAVFTEPQFDRQHAQRVAERAGVKLGVLDPIGEGDWFALMQNNLDAISVALENSVR